MTGDIVTKPMRLVQNIDEHAVLVDPGTDCPISNSRRSENIITSAPPSMKIIASPDTIIPNQAIVIPPIVKSNANRKLSTSRFMFDAIVKYCFPQEKVLSWLGMFV